MRLHAEGNAALSLSVLRPRQWWRDDYAWSWDTSVDRFLVAERGDHIVGYLRAMRHAGELAVMDAAPFAGEECHHAALLRHVLETAEGVKTVSGPVPSGSPLDEALRALPGETRIWESEGMMLRLIDAGGLLRKVLPRGSAQWSGIPSGAWRGRLTVNLAAGPVCLDICDSTSVDTEAIARREIELCDRDFLLLVLGCTEIDRLAFARDGRLPDDLRATLGHLFPKRPQVFWAMDHF